MLPVVDALRRVAATNATVLLMGESGTGKEVAARTLHAWSPRAAGAFVAVNCAAIPETLLESELFGHEKGAFTGAVSARRGRIELADGGTFFLDEIGEMPPALQAKLLRVLEDRRFERVGGSRTIEADVRWVAATNRDVEELRTSGRLREDLYHRLAVFPIRLPPLRERPRDILPLAEKLLARVGAAVGRAHLTLSPGARQLLVAAHWPGNVRELANVLERAAILANGDEIREEHLELGDAAAPLQAGGNGGKLEDVERTAIELALAAVGGNRRAAADRLGIGLRTLYDKLKRYRGEGSEE
jgi:two-component system response regulator FlrC